jgi:MFS family permease
MMAPMYASMLGMFFIITLYVQTVLHYSPAEAGLAIVPFPLVVGFMSTRISGLVARFGYKRFLIAGPVTVALALLWFSRLPVDGNYLINLLPAIIVMAFGIGMTSMPIIASATAGVPAREAGLASGLISTSQQMGGALGLSIMSGVAASVTAANLSLGKTAALVQGYDHAMLVALVFMVFVATLAVTVIRQPRTPKHGGEASQSFKHIVIEA